MDIWDILGIEKTNDKEVIQAAYRSCLMKTHPEEDPEGFMELRRALESALKAADEPEDKDEKEAMCSFGEGPVGDWMRKVDKVYQSFSKRIDPLQWKLLLQEDVCLNLDTRIQARNALLEYMMEHFFLPQSVVCVLDQQLGLRESMEELREEFPQNFLDVVITESIEQKEYPPYEYLQGDDSLPFDRYLQLSSSLGRCIGEGDTKQAHQIIDKMEKTGIKSPFLRIDEAKIYCQEKDYEKSAQLIEDLLPEFENLDDVHLMKADISFLQDDYSAAQREYEKIIKRDPSSEWARMGIGKCLTKSGDYKEANDIFCTLLEEDPYNLAASDWLKTCNEMYISRLEEELKAGGGTEVVLDLAWCFYQNEEYQKTIDLLQHTEPENDQELDYYSLLGRSSLYLGQTQALEYLKKWEELLSELSDEEKDQKKKKQLSYVLLLESGAYSEAGDKEMALRQLEKALELDPEDGEALCQKGQLLMDLWEYEKAVDVLTRSIEKMPGSHTTYLFRAKALFHLGYFGEAFDDCEKSLEIYPYELGTHIYKIKVLIEAGELSAAEDGVRYLKEEGLTGTEITFLEGFIKEAAGNYQEAEGIYKSILSKKPDGQKKENCFDMEDRAEVWHHLAVMAYNEDADDFEPVIRIIDGGLEENPDYVPLLDLKAEIAYSCQHFEEAISIYQKIIELAPGKIGTYGLMDSVFRDMEQWDEALECACRQLEQTPTGYAYMRRGQILTCIDRLNEAEEDFNKAIGIAPDLPYPYNYMGVLLEIQEKEEDALSYYEKAIFIGEEEGDPCGEAYKNASNLYCRKNNFPKALELLERGYELLENTRFLYDEIPVYLLAGDFSGAEEALEAYRKAEGLRRNSFEYKWELASIKRDSGDLDLAFSIYDAEAEDNGAACREAGKILYYKGKYKKAMKYFKKALKLWKYLREDLFFKAEYYIWAARTALALGDKKEAAELAERGIKCIPADYETGLSSCLPLVFKLLGSLYAAGGDYETAKRFLEKALEVRKCDYCNYSCCADAFYERGYLYQLQQQEKAAMDSYKKGLDAAPYDMDLVCAVKLLEKGKL